MEVNKIITELTKAAAKVAQRRLLPDLEDCKTIRHARIRVNKYDRDHTAFAAELMKIRDELRRLEHGQMSAREFAEKLYSVYRATDSEAHFWHNLSPYYKERWEAVAAFARSRGAAAPSLPSAEELAYKLAADKCPKCKSTKPTCESGGYRWRHNNGCAGPTICRASEVWAALAALSSDKVSKEENNNG